MVMRSPYGAPHVTEGSAATDAPTLACADLLAAHVSPGNRLRVLQDGIETLPAMFRAIRGARRYIHLEYYVFEDVRCCGESLFNLLIAQSRRGVQVAIIFDAVGSSSTPSAQFARLQRHGIHLLSFNPVNPLKRRAPYSLNRRDHRKILIADGRLAIVGGINMSRAYESPLRNQRRWRDTDLQVQGPSVAQLQRLFLDHWQSQGGVGLEDRDFYPALTHKGAERVAIIGGCPGNGGTCFYEVLLATLRAARSRIWITAGYFLPTAPLIHELTLAATRGVDVRLLLPSHNDSVAALAVQRSTYTRLLAAGVGILERSSVILHSKTAVIDKSWSCVGTSNIDARSVRYNDEVDAIVLGTDTAQSLMQLFLDDVSKARVIEPAAWKSRPLIEKLSELIWRPCQGLL